MRTDPEEVEHYNQQSRSLANLEGLRMSTGAAAELATRGGLPVSAWLHTQFDSVAQAEAICHVLPRIRGGRVLQIGGVGATALKALLSGAVESILLTPSSGELEVTRMVAREYGLSDRLTTVRGFAEEAPFDADSVDVVISEASMHHTEFVAAMAAMHRVLRPGGRFGCFEPWRAPLYRLGTRILGKRDPGVHCTPLDASRTKGVDASFPGLEITWHGALSRYPLIAASKFGLSVPRAAVENIMRVDDRVASLVPGLRRNMGSSVSIIGTKSAAA